jgi:hypothetical protein
MSEQTTIAEPETAGGHWVNLRDERGDTQARFHTGLMLLIVTVKGRKTPHDLRKYLGGESIKPRRAGA